MPFWDLYCKYLVKDVLCLEIILNLPSCVLLCQSHCLPRPGSTWLFVIPRVRRLPVNLRIIGQMQVANAANEPPCIVECLAQLSRLRFTWLLVMYSFQANIKQILSGKPCCPVPSALLPFSCSLFLPFRARQSVKLHWSPSSFLKIACKTCENYASNIFATRTSKKQQNFKSCYMLFCHVYNSLCWDLEAWNAEDVEFCHSALKYQEQHLALQVSSSAKQTMRGRHSFGAIR